MPKRPVDRVVSAIAAMVVVLSTLVAAWVVPAATELAESDRDVAAQWRRVQDAHHRRNLAALELLWLVGGRLMASESVTAEEREVFKRVPDVYASPRLLLEPKRLSDPQAFGWFLEYQQRLSREVGRLLAVAGRHTSVATDPAVQKRIHKITAAEEELEVERSRFDDTAGRYNALLTSPRGKILAMYHGLDRRMTFRAANPPEDPLIAVNRELYDLQTRVEVQWRRVQDAYRRRNQLVMEYLSPVGTRAHLDPSLTPDEHRLFEEVPARYVNPRLLLEPEQVGDERAVHCFLATQQHFWESGQRLLAVADRYPDLKGDRKAQRLREAIEAASGQLAAEQSRFDDLVQTYNARLNAAAKGALGVGDTFRRSLSFRTVGVISASLSDCG